MSNIFHHHHPTFSVPVLPKSNSNTHLNQDQTGQNRLNHTHHISTLQTLETLRRSPSISSISTSTTPPIKSYIKLHKNQLDKISSQVDDDISLCDRVKEYFKKRTELESSYLKDLEKLNKGYLVKCAVQNENHSGHNEGSGSIVFGKKLRRSSSSTYKERPVSTMSTANPFQPLKPSVSSSALPNRTNFTLSSGKLKSSLSSNSLVRETSPTEQSITRDQGSTLLTFQTILLETEKNIKQRQMQLYDSIPAILEKFKELSKLKRANHKKLSEQISKIQSDVLQEYIDLDKFKRSYEDAYKIYISFDKGKVVKNKNKVDEAEAKLIQCRNDYLLQHNITNSIHSVYYQDLLPLQLKSVDGEFNKTFASLLGEWNRLKKDYLNTLKESCENIDESISSIDNETTLRNNSSSTAPPFFPLLTEEDDDPHVVANLKNPLPILISLQNDLDAIIKSKESHLEGLLSLKETYINNPNFGNASTIETESTIQDLIIAKFNFVKVSSLVRMWSTNEVVNSNIRSNWALSDIIEVVKCVSPGFVGDDKCVSAYVECLSKQKPKPRLRDDRACEFLSSVNINSMNLDERNINQTKQNIQNVTVKTAVDHNPPLKEVPFSLNKSKELNPNTKRAKAKYDYDGEVEGDLPISEGDDVLVLSEKDENWVEGYNLNKGKFGIVPVLYLEF